MKTNNIIKLILSGALAVTLTACDDFLDVQPDNRTTIDSSDKAAKMLVSAYSDHQPWFFLELASDNVDDHGNNFSGRDPYYEECFKWADPMETDNSSPQRTWESQYGAIANANQVLLALDNMEMTDDLRAIRGEALVCRAYAHFILVNVFCQHYDPAHPEDLGIPYMTVAETTLNPKYERGTVHEVYAQIEKDLEEGLPLINDALYSVPKFHFNKRAANSFAARFYLFYQKWDKAAACATEAISTNPKPMLRDFTEYANVMSAAPSYNDGAIYYVSADHQCNFMIATDYSVHGIYYSSSSTTKYKVFNHGQVIANNESVNAVGYPYAPTDDVKPSWRFATRNYTGGNDRILLPHISNNFEYTDPVAGTGYRHSVHVLFTADETLLTRAEAYIMQKDYAKALADMNLYIENACSSYRELTLENVKAWAEKTPYYNVDDLDNLVLTPKKALNPAFPIDADQEAMIHVLLSLRRYETLHCGLRWLDVKRFGIEIYRRLLTSNNLGILSIDDKLVVRDPRRAKQLPNDVISAGLEPNPSK